MDSLKELTDFLKKQDNGASFSELKNIFGNEDQIRQFAKIGLENEVIFTTGQKRGTRYYANGKTPLAKSEVTNKKEKKVEKEDSVYVPDFDVTTDVNAFLQSDKPIPGQGVVTDVIAFGDKDTDNIKKFLSGGITTKTHFIEWNKSLKRNVVTQVTEHKIYNKIGIRCNGKRDFVFEKVYAKDGRKEQKAFNDYEEFREYLRANLQ